MSAKFKAEARHFFSTLPEETARIYEKKISMFSESHCSLSEIADLEEMVAGREEYAYSAFFCLCTIFRRNKDYQKLHHLLQQNEDFSSHISFNHITVMYMVHSESIFDYDELLQLAYQDALHFTDNSGYLNTFSNAFVTICEKCDEEDRSRIIEKWCARALEMIDRALILEPHYAKFYYNKARILTLLSRFDEADQLLITAISIENSARPDYVMAIMNYQLCRFKIMMDKQKQYFNRRISYMEQLLDISPMEQKKIKAKKRPSVYKGNEKYVFVSYAHMDSEMIYKSIRKLQKQNINIWYDAGIRANEEWNEIIGEQLMGCSCMILFLTNVSVKSAYVRREIVMALSHNKPIIVVMLENVALTPGMELQFSMEQIIMHYQMTEKASFDELMEALHKIGLQRF